MPNVLASWVKMWASSALRSSALVGMQPTFRQTPPQYFSSTTAVDSPSWAARIGGHVAAGPGTEHDNVIVCTHTANLRGRHELRLQCPDLSDTRAGLTGNLTYEISLL